MAVLSTETVLGLYIHTHVHTFTHCPVMGVQWEMVITHYWLSPHNQNWPPCDLTKSLSLTHDVFCVQSIVPYCGVMWGSVHHTWCGVCETQYMEHGEGCV